MKTIVPIFLAFILLTACGPKEKRWLEGEWEMDARATFVDFAEAAGGDPGDPSIDWYAENTTGEIRIDGDEMYLRLSLPDRGELVREGTIEISSVEEGVVVGSFDDGDSVEGFTMTFDHEDRMHWSPEAADGAVRYHFDRSE